MKRILAIVCLTLTLQGCVAAFLVGAAAGGLIVYDARDLTTIRDDQNISEGLNRKIVRDPVFRHSHIAVASYHRDVLLVGQTPEASLRVTAEKIARTMPGIRRIYNEIQISSPSSLMTRSSDTWITTKVKAEMVATAKLKSGDIKVVTEDGVVFLMGHVTRNQATAAVDVARRVSGVQKVVKVFRYNR